MSLAGTSTNISQIDPSLQLACVYALSGAYGALPRFLYYATLVFAIFGRNQEWLVIGALVSSLAYAGTSAIHVMALCTSKQGVYDLDALGAWAILSTAAIAYVAMIHWSSTMRNSRARVVMVIWGVLIGTALIFNRTVLFDTPYGDFENACYSSDGILLTSKSELIKTEFNCTYECFNIHKPMRGTAEIIAVPRSVIDSKYWNLSYILVGPVMFAAYVAISYDSRQHTPSQLCARTVIQYLNPRNKEEMIKLIWRASHDTWYGGYFVLIQYMSRQSWSVKKALMYILAYPWISLGLIMDLLCIPLLITNVIFNELNLLQSGIPVGESIYNVGQWSPVVNSALVVIAAIINKGMEIWEERRKSKAAKLEELEAANAATEPFHRIHRIDTDATLVEAIEIGHENQSKTSTLQTPKAYHDGVGKNGDVGISQPTSDVDRLA